MVNNKTANYSSSFEYYSNYYYYLTMKTASGSLLEESVLIPTFSIGDTIRWHIDLRSNYPRGILCRRLVAILVFGAEKIDQDGSTKWREEYTFSQVPVAISSTTSSVEVGVEYLVSFTVQPEHVPSSAQFLVDYIDDDQIQPSLWLKCTPVHDLPSAAYTLAESEAFKIQWTSHTVDKEAPSALAFIHDISPEDFYHESQFECPILKIRPMNPIRVGRFSYERDAFRSYLRQFNEIQSIESMNLDFKVPCTPEIICPFRATIEGVCVDMHLIYKIRKYAEESMDSILASKRQLRARELSLPALRTKTTFYRNMGLDGDYIGFSYYLHVSGYAKKLRALSRMISRYSQLLKGEKDFAGSIMALLDDFAWADFATSILILASMLLYATAQIFLYSNPNTYSALIERLGRYHLLPMSVVYSSPRDSLSHILLRPILMYIILMYAAFPGWKHLLENLVDRCWSAHQTVVDQSIAGFNRRIGQLSFPSFPADESEDIR